MTKLATYTTLAGTLRRMEIGQTIEVPETLRTESSARWAANDIKRRYGLVFTVNRCNGGVTVTRTA